MNHECPTWNEVAMKPKGYFVQDVKGQTPEDPLPGLVSWWQSNLASHVDFTNSEAVTWWKVREK